MDPRITFGLSIGLSFVSSAVIAKLHAWPRLHAMPRTEALRWLVAPHMFLRFIGLSFVVPGVVSARLPAAFAIPAAYGDLGAGLLAVLAFLALARRSAWAIAIVWLFNLWGAADLLFAFVQGARTHLAPGELGASYFIVTAIVPPMLVIHVLVFRLLASDREEAIAAH